MHDSILLEQMKTIEQLTTLCKELTEELAQFKSIEAEEKRLANITKEDNAHENINS